MEKEKKIIELVKNLFEDLDTENFNLDTEFKNNDEWDSMTALALITSLDEEFNVSVSAKKINELVSIRDILHYING